MGGSTKKKPEEWHEGGDPKIKFQHYSNLVTKSHNGPVFYLGTSTQAVAGSITPETISPTKSYVSTKPECATQFLSACPIERPPNQRTPCSFHRKTFPSKQDGPTSSPTSNIRSSTLVPSATISALLCLTTNRWLYTTKTHANLWCRECAIQKQHYTWSACTSLRYRRHPPHLTTKLQTMCMRLNPSRI